MVLRVAMFTQKRGNLCAAHKQPETFALVGSESLGVGALPTRGYAGGRCDLELS